MRTKAHGLWQAFYYFTENWKGKAENILWVMCFSRFGVKEIIEIWWETPWKITSELWKPHSTLFWDTKEKIGVQCPSDQEHNPEYMLFSTAWLLIPPGLRSAHKSPRYICQDNGRQWSMHKCKSWEANAALLPQGLCMCPNHKASDSCFIFADLMVLLPVCYLHHTDGGYSSWPPLPPGSTSRHHLLSVLLGWKLGHRLGKRNHSSEMPQKHISQCLSAVQNPPPFSAATFQQEGPSTL